MWQTVSLTNQGKEKNIKNEAKRIKDVVFQKQLFSVVSKGSLFVFSYLEIQKNHVSSLALSPHLPG